jgi:GT2 family glycosyltransferase
VRTNGIPESRGVWQLDMGQYDHVEYVFGAAGVAPAFRKSMIEDTGPFDADFGSYCEDVDLSWRAQLAGYRCLYVPTAILYHKVSATGSGPIRSFYVGRNTIWTLFKNLPTSLWHKYRSAIVGAQVQRMWDAVHAWRGAAARATIRGQIAGMLTLPRLRGKRRAIQSARRVEDAYIDSLLVPA